ncbi:MAG: SOS response-associated peptidase [Pseudomonadota bacterium]
MCGRFLFTSAAEAMQQIFKVKTDLSLPARYNIAPTQDILVYSIREEIGPCLLPMRWGLVPTWMKEIPPTPVFNARAETIHEKPFFRGPYRHHRCLIPANGWYEWADLDGERRPYVMASDNYAPLVFAGLCDLWSGADGQSYLLSAAIVTRPSVGHLENVHHRMPLLLSEEGQRLWMDHRNFRPPDPLNADLLDDLEAMSIRPANRDVGNVRNDGPRLLDPGDGFLNALT